MNRGHIQTIQNEKLKIKSKRDQGELEAAHQGAQPIEDFVSSNTSTSQSRIRARQEDPIGMLKAMTIMQGRMTLELERLQQDPAHQDSAAIKACEDELKHLVAALQEPGFVYERHTLDSALGQLGLRSIERRVTPEDPLVKLTRAYHHFETRELLPARVPLEEADRETVEAALNELNKTFRDYCGIMTILQAEKAKPRVGISRRAKYRSQSEVDRLTQEKRNIYKSAWVSQRPKGVMAVLRR